MLARPPVRPPVRRAAVWAALVGLAALVAACDGGSEEPVAADLASRLADVDAFVPLADALALTDLDARLATGGPYTVLAPTRTALRYVGTDFSPVLFAEAQRAILARVLLHHVVEGALAPDDFADGATLTALDGSRLVVRRIGPVVTVNGVALDVSAPTAADNGVAYPLADVLLDGIATRDRLRLSPSLAAFATGLANTGVLPQVAALERLTVLAPLDDAYLALGPENDRLRNTPDVFAQTLRALVLPGDVDLDARVGQTVTTLGGDVLPVTRDDRGGLRVDGVRVLVRETTADGRLYVLAEPVLSVLSILDRLRIRPDLTRYLRDATQQPTVRAALADRSAAVTLFAPSDRRYSDQSTALTDALAEPAQATVARRLVAVQAVRGRFGRADLADGLRLTALDGTLLPVTNGSGTITVGSFLVLSEPLRAANGLIYVNDFFILPDVDLFDTILLREYVSFFRLVRANGLETAYRTQVRTAFVLPDNLVGSVGANAETATILRRTATTRFLPNVAALSYPTSFEALNGDTRTLHFLRCGDNPDDRACSPYGFELVSVVFDGETYQIPTPLLYQGSLTFDRTAVFHTLREPDFLRAPAPPRPAARRAS